MSINGVDVMSRAVLASICGLQKLPLFFFFPARCVASFTERAEPDEIAPEPEPRPSLSTTTTGRGSKNSLKRTYHGCENDKRRLLKVQSDTCHSSSSRRQRMYDKRRGKGREREKKNQNRRVLGVSSPDRTHRHRTRSVCAATEREV